MSAGDRSLATSTGISAQGSSGQSSMTSGGPNSTDEQTEPASSQSIFAIDYKK